MCTMPCSLRAWYSRKSLRYCSRAWPMPATFPWPKMPIAPPKKGWVSPSRSTRWAARNRMTAWPTVSRWVGLELGTESPSAVKGLVGRESALRVWVARDKGKSAVETNALPHILGGLQAGVLESLQGALRCGACENVEIVEVVAVGCDGGVISPRDQEKVPVVHRLCEVEVPFGTVDPLHGPSV